MTAYLMVKFNRDVFVNGPSHFTNIQHIPHISWEKAYPASLAGHGKSWRFDVWVSAHKTVPANEEELYVDAECIRLWAIDQDNFAELNRIDKEIEQLQDERQEVELRLWQNIG